MIKVSVIIPTYGDPVYLEKAIESVLNQTLKDIELIIVDDNNPDTPDRKKTEKLVSTYTDRTIYIKHDKNRNGAAARNTGIRQAQGEYIAFLDSDDEYAPERLEKCYEKMVNSSNQYGAVYTGCEFYRGNKHYFTYNSVASGNYLNDTLACTFMFCTGSNIFMRTSIVKELCGFDESFLRHQDYEFMVRFFEKYSIAAIEEVLVRKNDEHFNVPNVDKLIEIKKQYLDKYSYIINRLPESQQKSIYLSQYFQIAQAAIENRNKELFGKYYTLCKDYGIDVKAKVKLFLLRIKNHI